MMRAKKCAAVLALLLSLPAAAQGVTATNAWVRGTIPGQPVTGAFMTLSSTGDGTVVSVSSPVAGTAEIHRMVLEDNVMKMRPLSKLELPAGKSVNLNPGGYHIMLMDLKRPLRAGESVPLILTVESAAGKRQVIGVAAVVRPLQAPDYATVH
jgi:copper(I)-binding protein